MSRVPLQLHRACSVELEAQFFVCGAPAVQLHSAGPVPHMTLPCPEQVVVSEYWQRLPSQGSSQAQVPSARAWPWPRQVMASEYSQRVPLNPAKQLHLTPLQVVVLSAHAAWPRPLHCRRSEYLQPGPIESEHWHVPLNRAAPRPPHVCASVCWQFGPAMPAPSHAQLPSKLAVPRLLHVSQSEYWQWDPLNLGSHVQDPSALATP